MAHNVYLVDGRRTPFGRFGGTLRNEKPVDLAVRAASALLEALGLEPLLIDHVVFANVIPSTIDTFYASRHIALRLGCSEETAGYNINRLCGSGIQAVVDAAALVKRAKAGCVLVVGAEAMSLSPHLIYGARFGTKYGALGSVDMLWDTLTDPYCATSMGMSAENLSSLYGITRLRSDEFSYHSHRRAAQAYDRDCFAGEIVGAAGLLCDEHMRLDISLEGMAALKPTFKADGIVTAASSSGIVDGAAALIVAGEDFVTDHRLDPLAVVCEDSVVGVDPKIMGIGAARSIKKLFGVGGFGIGDVDLFEINEAFAGQVLSCVDELGLDEEKINVWGGAIALGHPLGATGIRLSLTLARQLRLLDKSLGVASACIGGGQGIALSLERC